MPLVPSIFLSFLLFLFLKDYFGVLPAALSSIVAALIALAASIFLKRKPYVGSFLRLNLNRDVPVLEFGGKSFTAAGISVSSSQDDDSLRIEKEASYDRMQRFSEAMKTIGAPAAYILYSIPRQGFGRSFDPETRAIMFSWMPAEDWSDLSERTEFIFRQMEGIMTLVYPKAQTRRLDQRELSLLLSSPIPHSLSKLCKPLEEPLLGKPMPAPPPPISPDPSSLLPAPEVPCGGGGPLVGTVYSRGREVAPLFLRMEDIRRHISIFGATGSGKSTTAASLALRLYSLGASVLILDWHGEHTTAVEDAGGKVFRPGVEGGLTVNPIAGAGRADSAFQVEFITDMFSQVFRFTPPQSYMFREALKAAYRSRIAPTLSDLIAELSLLPMRSSWDHETRMALMRRLKSFTEGACGFALSGADSVPREEIFQGLVSIDLTNLRDVNNRVVYANVLLKMVYDYCVQRGEQSALSHVTFIEEAQNVFPPRRPEDPVTIGERILAELRKFGEGVVVVSQFPSSVSHDVIKNTAVRIIHAIRSGEDLEIIASATSMDERQMRAIPMLSVGEAVVSLPQRSGNFFVRVSPDPLVSMTKISQGTPGGSPPSAAPQPS